MAHSSGNRSTEGKPDPQMAPKDEPDPKVLKMLPGDVASGREDAALVRPSALQLYLSRIRQYPILTPEEEHELAVKYSEEGDRDAAFKLVTSNLRLVFKIALEFQRSWMNNLLDLVQEGNVGLMQAVKKFDPYRQTRLSSYASFWIKAYILKFILDNWRLVKIGKTQAERKLFFNLYKEKERLTRLGYDPGPRMIAERLNVREEDVIRMDQRLGSWEVSMEKPLKDDSSSQTMGDILPASIDPVDEKMADDQIRRLATGRLLEFGGTLKGREREIFDERLLAENPITLQELGDRYGITKERVRQLEVRVMQKLRAYLVKTIPDAEQVIPDFLSHLSP